MSKRPTPDTDAVAAYEGNWDTKALRMTAHARRLERERNEAREHLAAIKHYLTKERDDALAQIVQAECRAERFCQERDEAREKYDIEATEHMLAINKLCNERDEAREAASRLAKQAEQLRKERDELKEALLIMENLLKPGIELFPEIGEILKQGAK